MANIIVTDENLKGWFPDQKAFGKKLAEISLLQNITQLVAPVSGDENGVLVPYLPTNPEVGFVKEGTEIPSADAQLHEAFIKTGKVGIIQEMSWEALRQGIDIADPLTSRPASAADPHGYLTNIFTQSNNAKMLMGNMSNGIVRKVNHALFNNQDTLGSKGLLHVDNVKTAPGTVDGTNLDPISDAISMIEGALGNPSHIVLNPIDWGKLRKTKTTNNAATLLLGNATDETPSTLFGVPVVVAAAMPQGTALVLDKTSVLSAYGAMHFNVSDQAAFTRDTVVARMTWRFGATVLYPQHLVKVTFTQD